MSPYILIQIKVFVAPSVVGAGCPMQSRTRLTRTRQRCIVEGQSFTRARVKAGKGRNRLERISGRGVMENGKERTGDYSPVSCLSSHSVMASAMICVIGISVFLLYSLSLIMSSTGRRVAKAASMIIPPFLLLWRDIYLLSL